MLLDARGHVRLVDFGVAKKFAGDDDRCTTSLGTPQYMAPEQLTTSNDKRVYTKVVDWWAFACLVYEMVAGHMPFAFDKGESQYALYTRILKGKVQWPRSMSSTLKDLLHKMLQPNLQKRLVQPEAIKDHAWFQNVDWDRLLQCKVQAPFVPKLTVVGDASHFDEYPAETNAEDRGATSQKYAAAFRNF